MLRFLTAGESHGRGLTVILEGMPAGLRIEGSRINRELKRRQCGFGRGKRMEIENDRAQIISGLKGGVTLGSPIALLIENKDQSIEKLHKVMSPRPGHADLAGTLKYGFTDVREVLERASARSTAATVAVGAVCKALLDEFGITLDSAVLSIGGQTSPEGRHAMISEAFRRKDTVGGIFEVTVKGVPVGLGSYAHPDRKLSARLAYHMMGIPGIKAFEVGIGFEYGRHFGSEVHDPIYYSRQNKYYRTSNNSGGIEGGVSNGEDIVVRACIKPISTLMNPLPSVNIATKRTAPAATERSDTCVAEAAGVVGEAACAYAIAEAFLEKFGGDNIADIRAALRHYLKRLNQA